MKARTYVEQIEKIDVMIRNKLIEKEQWMAIATSTTASASDGERVQSSGSQQKMANAVIKCVELEEEINKDIDTLVDMKQEVIRTLEQLNVIEYDLMHQRYIQFKSFEEIAHDFNKTYTWATTVHGRALKSIQRILDQKKEGD